LDEIVGMFVNTLVLRTEIDSAAGFADVVAATRSTDLDAFANADVPFEHLVEKLNPLRSEAFSPLTQVMLAYQRALSDEIALPDLSVTPVDAGAPSAKVDLTIEVSPERADDPTAALGGNIIYATDLFTEATIVEFASRFERLLGELVTAPATPVGDVELLTESDRRRRRALSAGRDKDLPRDTVPAAVVRQAAATPDATALVSGDRTLTYREFAARVNVLARDLIAHGVTPDTAVAVCIPRSVEMVLAIHAVVTAGGQYVPVDPGVPADRARYMVDTAGVGVVLVDAHTDRPAAIDDLAAELRIVEVDAAAEVDPDHPASAEVTDADR
ncbi:AMP-binding protein, partial [Streptomyces sp. SID10244]|nr:AMP-binding protein [Streptomyces sp. SID10244]